MSVSRPSKFNVAVVVLGAGASARMGRPKLLLPWEGTSVVGHLLEQWRRIGARQLAVVVAEGNSALRAELERLGLSEAGRILNPHPEAGMFSSIRCAARWGGWCEELTHWVITLGDQPHVRSETLRALLDFGVAQPANICQPARQGRARHPVLLPGPIFRELRDAPEENFKQFLLNRVQLRLLCEMDDSGLDFDLDEPEDYERALRLTTPGRASL